MVLSRLGYAQDLKGGDAAALVGGVAAALMICATLAADGLRKALDASADHVTRGFVFAFRAMGSVLPIAGFFFLGAGGVSRLVRWACRRRTRRGCCSN